jgi:hypothetical protein
MKRSGFMLGLVLAVGVALPAAYAEDDSGRDSTGLPGDHFSLQGALEMFKKASSPEEFEKLLNEPDNHVNNLDLNGDGDVDYIRVVGSVKGDAHVFALQVPIAENESQDIAVIELEKSGNENAVLQIVGDGDIFGEMTIVEPDGGGKDEDEEDVESDESPRGPHAGLAAGIMLAPPRIVVNVWPWPIVRFVYAPGYRAWVSPWRWRVYPAWWRPWRPLAWRVFHPFRARHHVGFAVVRTHRVVGAHRIYAPTRVTSASVRTRHGAHVDRYRVTRKTTVHTRGGATKVKTTRTTTRVHKKR